VTDSEVKWDLEDSRTLTKVMVPSDKYKLADFGQMDLNREGYARPLLFGRTRTALVRPTRTGVFGAGGYGQYEIYDNMIQPGTSTGVLRSYPNGELADKDLLGFTINDSVNDYTFSGATIQVLRDIRNYRFDRAGNDVGTGTSFDFNVGAGALVANVDLQGPAYLVAATLQAAMRAAIGGGDTTTLVTYDEATHKFRTRRTSGTLNLLPPSGANAHKESWKILGYDTGSDKITANDYTGEQPTFTGPDQDHILRVQDTQGYEEDSAGTILGAATGTDLDTPAAVASWLLQRVAKVPRARIDIAGFKAAHDGHRANNMQLRAYLDSPQDLSGVLARLEQAGLMDLTVDGEGVWHCNRYTDGAVGALELFDRDYLSWEMHYDARSIYRLVRVLYGYDPARGQWRKSHEESVDTGIPVKHGSDEILEVLSYFDDDSGLISAAAQRLALRLQRLSSNIPRIVSFGIAGRLAKKLLGEKVKLTRTATGVLSTTGALAAVPFRIVSLRHNYLSGISHCVAVEDVSFLEVDSVQIDVFVANGTWLKNPAAKSIWALVIGGGPGGGSGRKGAAGSNRSGGGGGGGGGFTFAVIPASVLASTETVTVGAGGIGGAAQAVNSTDGNNGAAGGASSFGTWLRAGGGMPGSGGTTTIGALGLGGKNAEVIGGNGGNGNSTSGGDPGQDLSILDAHLAPAGGGGGGGINSANTATNGGAGAASSPARGTSPAGGAAGTTPGGLGGAGASVAANEGAGGAGGGGGAARTDAGTNGVGGAGGNYGGGGGGGAAGVDGVVDSGAGGNGAGGIVIVVQA